MYWSKHVDGLSVSSARTAELAVVKVELLKGVQVAELGGYGTW